jgi:glycosyltransferase involved in cell wall biosynthesis
MKRVLVLAYYFPPLGMGGVRRIGTFCKYLPKFGWKPIVITVKPIQYFAQDEEFMKEIKCKIYRSESLDPLRIMKILGIKKKLVEIRKKAQKISNFLFPLDNKIGWLPFGVKMGISVIKKESPDIIFATAPPDTGLFIGYWLKKITHLPLVIEFRDAWRRLPYVPYPSPIHRYINENLRKKILNNADKIIATSQPKAPIFKNQKVHIIPHGYDPADLFYPSIQKESNKFTITYVGSFVPPRTPKYFIKAISNLVKAKKISSQDLKLEIIGFCDEKIKVNEEDLGLKGVVNFIPYRPHKECIKKMMQSDLLWMMEAEEGVYSGKIGEYLGTKKPILATAPKSLCAEVIRETKAGIVVPPKDIKAIEKAIYEFYIKYRAKQITIPIGIEKYNYINLTKGLSMLFNTLK